MRRMPEFPAWHFRVMDAGEVQVDPVHDEFFKMQDLVDALVRESIQNSLDARRGSSKVRVRFTFNSGSRALHATAARQYFRGLREHLDAVGTSMYSVLPSEAEPIPFLLIEDFGTRGLTGDPRIDPELEASGERNDFFYFWRNVGRSNKGEIDRGRWGLGKAVFSVASRIRTIFGLTRRADDARSLLLGQSVLKTHIIDGVRRYPYGFFALYEKRDGLPLPIEDPLLLERFFDDFTLSRTEPGLSVIVPYYREDELTFDKIAHSVIEQYFYPITRGDLVVELIDQARTETITSRTIEELGGRFGGDDAEKVRRLAALTRWSIVEADQNRVDVARGPAGKWNEELLGERVNELRDRFEAGERIAIRASLPIRKKRARMAASTYFDIYLEKDDSLKRGDTHFIRRGITIPDVKVNVDKPVRILVVIDDEPLSTFLGDAENPAHSDWSERADKLRTTYEGHAMPLRFVKNSAPMLATILSRPPQGRVRDFLGDIFSIEAPDDSASTSSKGENAARRAEAGENSAAATPGAEDGSRPASAIARVDGGFTLRGTGDERLVGKPLVAEVAYRIRNGNPFLKHSRFDFDLASDAITIATSGIEVRSRDANVIEFVVTSPKYSVTLKGFDVRRDLLVRVREGESDAAEA
jgi:hypothetical protein